MSILKQLLAKFQIHTYIDHETLFMKGSWDKFSFKLIWTQLGDEAWNVFSLDLRLKHQSFLS